MSVKRNVTEGPVGSGIEVGRSSVHVRGRGRTMAGDRGADALEIGDALGREPREQGRALHLIALEIAGLSSEPDGELGHDTPREVIEAVRGRIAMRQQCRTEALRVA